MARWRAPPSARTIRSRPTGAPHEDPTTETPFADLTLHEFAERLASRDPVPGGGSASALVASLAAGLVSMVAELSIGRAALPDLDPLLERVRHEAAELRASLLALADADAAAFSAVLSARRMPRATQPERAAREEAIGQMTLGAARVPLEVAEQAARVLELAAQIAPVSNPNAVSDAGVAALLAAAGARGALMNVRINLPGLPPGGRFSAEGGAIDAVADRLAATLDATEPGVLAEVGRRIGPS